MIKKISLVCAVCILLASLVFPCASAVTDSDTLSGTTINVFNWGQYISTGEDDTIDVLSEFTKSTGIKVNYATYDDNESMYTKLATGGSSYDIIIPSDYMIGKLIEEDMLEKINFDNVPNFQYISDSLKNPSYDPTGEYSVPYTWGTVGIIYNTKYVTKSVDSWSILWDEEYKDKILMFDNPRDAFAIAESLLGIDPNTNSEDELKKAADKLKEQKPLLQKYVMDQIFDSMTDETAWIAPYYAGDYLIMNEDNPNLAFATPKEGFNRFVDAVCIPKGASNKAGAEAFINFLCDPEICAANCEAIGYSMPLDEKYFPEDFEADEIAYPDEEALANTYAFNNLSEDATNKMNELWRDVKSVGSINWALYGTVAAVIIIAAVFLIIRKHRRNKLY
jgi:spermidine/putrescine transport system substrate-binding protein